MFPKNDDVSTISVHSYFSPLKNATVVCLLKKKIKLCASCPKISHLRMYEDKLVYRAEKYACNLVTEERNCILHLLQMTS